MEQLILKSKDDHVAIMYLAEDADKEKALKDFKESHPNENYEEMSIPDVKLPSSREFRDAWTIQNNKIVVDASKAADIHMSRIREARNKKLEELDKEQLKNISVPGMLVEIDKKKQVLRDLPANWALDITKWPSELS